MGAVDTASQLTRGHHPHGGFHRRWYRIWYIRFYGIQGYTDGTWNDGRLAVRVQVRDLQMDSTYGSPPHPTGRLARTAFAHRIQRIQVGARDGTQDTRQQIQQIDG